MRSVEAAWAPPYLTRVSFFLAYSTSSLRLPTGSDGARDQDDVVEDEQADRRQAIVHRRDALHDRRREERRRDDEDEVLVLGPVEHVVGGHHPGSADPVHRPDRILDDLLLVQHLGDAAHEDVGGAARRGADGELDGPFRRARLGRLRKSETRRRGDADGRRDGGEARRAEPRRSPNRDANPFIRFLHLV